MPNSNSPSGGPHKRIRTVRSAKPGSKKRPVSLSRWLHIYLSMVSFVIVLFFAVTGLTLNHAEWFGSKPVIKKQTGKLNVNWINNKDTTRVDKLNIVEFLRKTNKISGHVSEFRIDGPAISVAFNGPGNSADVYINRNDGNYQITETSFGLIAVLNDLHKGRDTGKSWSVVIDITAIFMSLISLTGIIMLCYMKKKRRTGFILLGAGVLIIYGIFHFLIK